MIKMPTGFAKYLTNNFLLALVSVMKVQYLAGLCCFGQFALPLSGFLHHLTISLFFTKLSIIKIMLAGFLSKPKRWQRALGSVQPLKDYAKEIGQCWIRTWTLEFMGSVYKIG